MRSTLCMRSPMNKPLNTVIAIAVVLTLGVSVVAFMPSLFVTVSAGVSVFLFFATWIVLWFVSEQLLIDHYLRVRGSGDTGYNYFYPGASGMGYAEGLARPDKILSRVLWFGGIGALLLSVPFGALLTGFKRQREQDGPSNGG
jgi:hypothetical protein